MRIELDRHNMSSTKLTNDIVEWLAGERVPVRRSDVLLEITKLARHCKLWPVATYEEWDAAIDEAIRDGRVVEENCKVRLRPTECKSGPSKQLELFE